MDGSNHLIPEQGFYKQNILKFQLLVIPIQRA
jgi:hypothetical protein